MPAVAPASAYAGFKKPAAAWINSGGLLIMGTFTRLNGAPAMDMTFSNQSGAPLSNFMVQFDKNSFKLRNAQDLAVGPLQAGASASTILPLAASGELGRQDPLNKLNIAFKADPAGVAYMSAEIPYNVLLDDDGALEKKPYLEMWQSIGGEEKLNLTGVSSSTAEIIAKCAANNVFHVATTSGASGEELAYFSMKFINGIVVLAELTMKGGGAVCVALKSPQPAVNVCAKGVFTDILAAAPVGGGNLLGL